MIHKSFTLESKSSMSSLIKPVVASPVNLAASITSVDDKIGSGACRSIWLQNKTTQTFTVIDRSNIPVVYSPPKDSYFSDNKIVLYVMYEWHTNESLLNTRKLLDMSLSGVNRSIHNEEQFIVYDILTREIKNRNTVANACVIITRSFSLSDFAMPHARRYVEACDVLIDSDYNKSYSFHPHSYSGRALYGEQQTQDHHAPVNPSIPLCSLRIEVDFVDNDGRHGNKYLYFGNNVITVMPIKDPSRPDGIYKTTKINQTGDVFADTVHMTLEDAKSNFGLSDSYDALQNTEQQTRDLLQKHEKEMADLKIADAEERRKNMRLQEQLDMQKRQADNAAATARAEAELQHMAELNRLRQEAQHKDIENAELLARMRQQHAEVELRNAATLADLKRKVEESKVNSTMSSHTTTMVEEDIRRQAANHKAYLDALAAERKSHYTQLEENMSLTATMAKHVPAVLVGVGGALLVNKLMSGSSSSFSSTGW